MPVKIYFLPQEPGETSKYIETISMLESIR